MKIRLLVVILFWHTILNAQFYQGINPQDTISYPITKASHLHLLIRSNEANIGVMIYENGKKIKTINESHAVGYPEIIKLKSSQKSNYELKIFALSFLKNTKKYSIEIKPFNVSDLNYYKAATNFEEDLKIFKTIREKANSGLYVYRNKKAMDSIYNWAFTEVKKCNTILDFYKIIVTLTDFEGSCHNSTFLPTVMDNYFSGSRYLPPLAFKNIGNKVVVNSEHLAIPLGAEILEINGKSISEITHQLATYYHTDGYSKPFKEIFAYEKGFFEKYIIAFGKPKSYRIKYRWNNEVKIMELESITKEKYNEVYNTRYSRIYDSLQLAKKYSLDEIDGNTYKLSVRGFDFASSKETAEYKNYEIFLNNTFTFLRDNNIKNLIIDLRYNTGGAGFLYEKLYTYLTTRPFRDSFYAYRNFKHLPYQDLFLITPYLQSTAVESVEKFISDLNQYTPIEANQNFYISDENNPLIFPNPLHYTGQIYLIIDENTASAAAHLASLIKSYTNAIVVGKETMGGFYEHNGHVPVEYQLPHSRIITKFSILHVVQDAKQLPDQVKGSGVIPHLKVTPTIEDFIQRRDVELNSIIQHINKKAD